MKLSDVESAIGVPLQRGETNGSLNGKIAAKSAIDELMALTTFLST